LRKEVDHEKIYGENGLMRLTVDHEKRGEVTVDKRGEVRKNKKRDSK
jgi:hypothetical protein